MEAEIDPTPIERSHDILRPERQTLPLVVASAHSGRCYPPDFVEASRLDRLSLRRSEDGFVEELFAAAPQLGAPLIQAHFPRAYVDANREPYELDPTMFAQPLPSYANTRSPRVAAGLGTIARIVANGAEIYRDCLAVSEALARIESCYWPYHRALAALLNETRRRFGHCILLDCHSMPSSAVGRGLGLADLPSSRDEQPDFVLGDAHGTSCAPQVTEAVESTLAALGYHVVLNNPYSGGFVTRHYGRPAERIHVLQIEINRALYMDERRMARAPGLAILAQRMEAVIASLGQLGAQDLAA